MRSFSSSMNQNQQQIRHQRQALRSDKNASNLVSVRNSIFITASLLLPQCAVNGFHIGLGTSTVTNIATTHSKLRHATSSPLSIKNSTPLLSPTSISTSTSTVPSYSTSTSSSRLFLGFWEKDDNNDVSVSTTTTTPPAPKVSKSILQTGGGPTIVIDPNETSDAIYASAISRTLSWVAAAILFGIGIFLSAGQEPAEEFFAGYLVEQSLSIDNIFVFLLLFDYFKVPLINQDRVLNYGIYGAIVMRAVMIGLGTVALSQFHGVLLVFASILIYSSASVLLGSSDEDEEDDDMAENTIVKFSNNLFDSTDKFDGNRFFTIQDGIKKATPLFICMVAVEISDVVFAVDSIPAVFGITENPLIVFSSNMFAIMGLRSLYTILSKAAKDLEYLEPAVALVLGFIGSKMVAEYFGIMVPTELSLGVVLTLLSSGVGLSIYTQKRGDEENDSDESSAETNSSR